MCYNKAFFLSNGIKHSKESEQYTNKYYYDWCILL